MLTFSCNADNTVNCEGLVAVTKELMQSARSSRIKMDLVSDLYIRMAEGKLDSGMSGLMVSKYCGGAVKIHEVSEYAASKKFKSLDTNSTHDDNEKEKNTVFEQATIAWFDNDAIYEIDSDEMGLLQELEEVAQDIMLTSGIDLKKCIAVALEGSAKAVKRLKELVEVENIGELVTEILEIKNIESKLISGIIGC